MPLTTIQTFDAWLDVGKTIYKQTVNGLPEDPACIADRDRLKGEFASLLAVDWIAWNQKPTNEHPYERFAKHLRGVVAGKTAIDKSCPKNTQIANFKLNIAAANSKEQSWVTYFHDDTGDVEITAANIFIQNGVRNQTYQYPTFTPEHRLVALNQMVGDLTHELCHSINALNVSSISNNLYSTRAEMICVATNLYYADVLGLTKPGLQVYGLDCPDATATILALDEWNHALVRAENNETILQQLRAYAGKVHSNANVLCLTSDDLQFFAGQATTQPSEAGLLAVTHCWR